MDFASGISSNKTRIIASKHKSDPASPLFKPQWLLIPLRRKAKLLVPVKNQPLACLASPMRRHVPTACSAPAGGACLCPVNTPCSPRLRALLLDPTWPPLSCHSRSLPKIHIPDHLYQRCPLVPLPPLGLNSLHSHGHSLSFCVSLLHLLASAPTGLKAPQRQASWGAGSLLDPQHLAQHLQMAGVL